MDHFVRLVAAAVTFLCLAMPAYAYLDPVTGSLLIQGLIAAIAGIVAGVKSVRTRIVVFVRSILGRKGS